MRALLSLALVLCATSSFAQQPPPLPPFAGGPVPTAQKATPAPAPQPAAAPTTGAPAPAPQPPAQAQITNTTVFSLDKPVLAMSPGTVLAKPDALMNHPALKDLPVARVRIKGQATGTPAAGGAAVNFDWTSVTLDDGSKTVGLAKPLSSRVLSAQPVIPQQQQMRAQGDVQPLVEAIQTLLKDTPATPTATAADLPKKQASGAPAGAPTPTVNPGRGGLEGSMSSPTASGNYKPWELPPATTPTDNPTTTYSEACPNPRVDLASLQVWPQARTVTTTNGVATPSACSDSGPAMNVQWDYASCSPVVDTAARVAHIYRKPYYIDSSTGMPRDLGTCQESTGEAIVMRAETNNCAPKIDLTAMTATQQAELVWTDRNGARNVAAPCAVTSDSTSYQVQETANGCTIRHDYVEHASYKQTRFYYTANGIEQPFKSCADTTTKYAHVNDTSMCQAITDTATGKYYRTASVRIDPPEGSQFITNCQPIDAGQDITETHTGCETQHRDDFTAGVSYLYSKWLLADGTAVTNCAESAHTVAHSYQVQGWDNNDATRTATQKLAVYANLPAPVGNTMIDGPAVRPTSAAVAYTYQGTQDVPDGTSTYQGCSAVRNTARSEVYQRPDGTAYTYPIGIGTPSAPIDVCVTTVIATQAVQVGWGKTTAYNGIETLGLGSQCNYTSTTYWQNVNKSELKNTETGEIVSTVCAMAGAWNAGWTTSTSGTGYAGVCTPSSPAQTLAVPPCPF